MAIENYKVSIIIPCYNAEQYVDRCLNSVINQTIGLEHMEIVLINDASTDHSLEKLMAWEQRFPNNIILITYDENLRQGGARNIGLEYATGKYIGFVDIDDWIETNMYENLISEMVTGKYDVVKCQLIREKGSADKTTFLPEWGGIVTGVYTRELIFKHHIMFPEHMSYEDNYWGSLISRYIKYEKRINRVLYHYYINPNSTVTCRNQISQLDRMKIETMLLDEYKKRGFFNVEREDIFDDFVKRYYLNTWYIIFTRFDEIPDVLSEMVTTFAYYFPNYKKRVEEKQFTYRSQLLIDMLLEPENHDVNIVKLRWLRSWLKDQGINVNKNSFNQDIK